MTQGKNPRNFKKKGGKKKVAHAFAKKDWFTVKAPSLYKGTDACITSVNRSAGLKKSGDSLKGRVFEVSLADLSPDAQDQSWRKIKLQCEEIKNEECLTSFYGMTMTRDKLCQIVKKWQSTIEAFVDVKTQDGSLMRLFAVAFTKRNRLQLKATSYAKTSQIKQIRSKMREIMLEVGQQNTLKQMAQIFIERKLEQRIERDCKKIYPLNHVYITKAKMLKSNSTIARLMEFYTAKAEETPQVDSAESKNLLEEGEKE